MSKVILRQFIREALINEAGDAITTMNLKGFKTSATNILDAAEGGIFDWWPKTWLGKKFGFGTGKSSETSDFIQNIKGAAVLTGGALAAYGLYSFFSANAENEDSKKELTDEEIEAGKLKLNNAIKELKLNDAIKIPDEINSDEMLLDSKNSGAVIAVIEKIKDEFIGNTSTYNSIIAFYYNNVNIDADSKAKQDFCYLHIISAEKVLNKILTIFKPIIESNDQNLAQFKSLTDALEEITSTRIGKAIKKLNDDLAAA